jgi:hypothetical protein
MMAERWLKFFSRCDPWPEDEVRLAVLAERRLIDAARAQSHRRGMRSLYYAGIHLVKLGLLTSRDAEQWLAPEH